MKKRVIKILLAVTIAVSLIVAVNLVADAETEYKFTYTVKNGEATISSSYFTPTGDLVIPSTIDGYPVTAIDDEAFRSATIKSVVIPEGVTSIGSDAFFACYSLKSVTMPDSITSIGEGAFSSCTSLTNIKIPEGVTVIASGTFNNCTSLESVKLPDTLTIIDNSAFRKCESLKTIEIPDGVASIGVAAFYNCKSLANVEIPRGVTSIESQAFYNCESFTSVEIPDGVTTIDDSAFYGCKSLISVEIPDSVTSIGQGIFSNCKSITDIYYMGTKSEWDAIPKDWYNESLETATIHYLGEPADYTKVDEAIVKANAVDRNLYTEASLKVLDDAISAVDYSLTLKDQATVDAFAVAIEEAVANLKRATVKVDGIRCEAFATGREVTLLADLALNEQLTISEDMTLDLNGYTVSGSFESDFGMIYVKKGATFTIVDSGENGNITSSATYAIGNYGTVIVKDGTVESTATNDYNASLYNFYYQSNYYGTTVIEGGNVGIVWNSGEMTVTGGTVEYIDNSGALTVTNGTVEEIFAKDGKHAAGVTGAGTIVITDPSVISIPNGYRLVKDNGVYKLIDSRYVAEVNGTYFETLKEAVALGGEVVLLTDVSGDGIVIDKDVIIDLGGYTYTINGTLVGSKNTETLGFQILRDNTVTIKNGVIAADVESIEVNNEKTLKMLIQNYANLTLEDVTMDMSTVEACLYVLSNNSGDVVITGTTNIIAPEGAVAFDVYDYSSAGYTVPTVSVDTTGTIIGAIEVSKTATLEISGGTFTVDVTEYCTDGCKVEANGDGTYSVRKYVKLTDSMVNYRLRCTTAVVDGNLVLTATTAGTSSMKARLALPEGATLEFVETNANASMASGIITVTNPGMKNVNVPMVITSANGVKTEFVLVADFNNAIRYATYARLAQTGDNITVTSGAATAYVLFDTTEIDGGYVEVENVSRNLLGRYVISGSAVRFYNPVYDEGTVTVNVKNANGETVETYNVTVIFADANEYTAVLDTSLRCTYEVDGDNITVTADAGVSNVYLNFGRYYSESLSASVNNDVIKKMGARSWRIMACDEPVEFDLYFDATAYDAEKVTRHVTVSF